MPFGKVREEEFDQEEEQEEKNVVTGKNIENNSVKIIPSKLFGVESPFGDSASKNFEVEISKTEKPQIDNKTEKNKNSGDNIHTKNQQKPQSFERNLISRSVNQDKKDIKINENVQKQDQKQKTRPSSASKFVLCVFCGKQYGAHSISIHEKNCRDRKTTEDVIRERLFKYTENTPDKKLSKSLGNLTNSNLHVLNGDSPLVTCDDCKRRFLSTDIEKHQINCRVAIL